VLQQNSSIGVNAANKLGLRSALAKGMVFNFGDLIKEHVLRRCDAPGNSIVHKSSCSSVPIPAPFDEDLLDLHRDILP
jgi:hypothetical protein